jgi:hypothetical protein
MPAYASDYRPVATILDRADAHGELPEPVTASTAADIVFDVDRRSAQRQ